MTKKKKKVTCFSPFPQSQRLTSHPSPSSTTHLSQSTEPPANSSYQTSSSASWSNAASAVRGNDNDSDRISNSSKGLAAATAAAAAAAAPAADAIGRESSARAARDMSACVAKKKRAQRANERWSILNKISHLSSKKKCRISVICGFISTCADCAVSVI